MSELDELRRRVEALEDDMARLGELERGMSRVRDESLTTRSFAGMIDREAAELRTSMQGHTKVLNALRQTQIEQGRTIQGLAEVVGGLVTGQTAMAERQNKMDERLASMAEQLQRIADRLDVGSAEA